MKNKNPAYRALIVSGASAILRSHRVVADSDQQAIEDAKKHKQPGLALEVWKDGRFVHEFSAEESFTENSSTRLSR